MLSVAEFAATIVAAAIMAQGVAWLYHRCSVRLAGAGTADIRRPRPALWGETTRANFHYVRRRSRYPVDCPVTYQTNQSAGDGMVTEMSREGWRIQTPTLMEVGTLMSLRICLPGHAAPVVISRAIVRWSENGAFGVTLLTLDPSSAAQLSEFFSTLTTGPVAAPMR